MRIKPLKHGRFIWDGKDMEIQLYPNEKIPNVQQIKLNRIYTKALSRFTFSVLTAHERKATKKR